MNRTAFQPDAFQPDAFQIEEEVAGSGVVPSVAYHLPAVDHIKANNEEVLLAFANLLARSRYGLRPKLH